MERETHEVFHENDVKLILDLIKTLVVIDVDCRGTFVRTTGTERDVRMWIVWFRAVWLHSLNGRIFGGM